MSSGLNIRKFLGMDILVPIWEGKQAVQPIQVPHGEIVSHPQRFHIPIRGKLLRVPPPYSAVLTHPNGYRKVYHLGDHYLDLPIATYMVQYVLARKQLTTLPPFQGVSRDGWGVSLHLKIYWIVTHPLLVVDTQNFLQTLISTCQAAVTDYIRAMPHDCLIQVPGEPQTKSALEITSAIQDGLVGREIFNGIKILEIILIDRQGDQRRTEVVQNAIVESKEIETELALQEQKTHLASTKIEQDLALVQQQRGLEIIQAETARLVTEEKEKQRLRFAEIEAQEAEWRRSVFLQKVELKRIENAQQLEFQEAMKALDVKGEVYKQIGRAMVDAVMLPDATFGSNGDARADLLEVMNMMIGSLRPASRPLQSGAETPNAYDRVLNEIIKACTVIPGISIGSLETYPSGKLQANFTYKASQIIVKLNGANPYLPPEISVVTGDSTRQIVNFEWGDGKGLIEVLRAVVNLINAPAHKKPSVPGSGNATWHQTNP